MFLSDLVRRSKFIRMEIYGTWEWDHLFRWCSNSNRLTQMREEIAIRWYIQLMIRWRFIRIDIIFSMLLHQPSCCWRRMWGNYDESCGANGRSAAEMYYLFFTDVEFNYVSSFMNQTTNIARVLWWIFREVEMRVWWTGRERPTITHMQSCMSSYNQQRYTRIAMTVILINNANLIKTQ